VIRFLWAWGPAIALMAAIYVLSAMPQPPGPENVSDKTLHFLAYAALGALALRGAARARWQGVSGRSGVTAWVIAAAYGASDEIHQYFVEDRTASLADWVADAAGAATAVAVIVLLAALLRGKRTV
jgi:VanZ family protein